MDSTLSVIPSRAASAIAYTWMAIKQFFLIGLIFPVVTAAALTVLFSGFSFTEVSRWLVQEQVTAQQLGAATKPDHLMVKSCPSASAVGGLPPVDAVICDEWEVHEMPIEAVVASTAHGLALAYFGLVVLGGVFLTLCWPPSFERARKHAVFLSSVITRLNPKGGNRG